MNRMLFFCAGLAAGFGAAYLGGMTLPGAQAAPPKVREGAADPGMPDAEPKRLFLEQRCAPGFRHTPAASGRYTCNRAASALCPKGATAVNIRLYRAGNDAAAPVRLTYECRTGEVVRPHCGRGFAPAGLKLYRSGMSPGASRLLYECVRYRSGNEP